MRKLGAISGIMILLFLISAMGHYENDSTRRLIALGAVFVGVAMIVIKLRPGKQKTKGYILRG
jgi:hypothetical protein